MRTSRFVNVCMIGMACIATAALPAHAVSQLDFGIIAPTGGVISFSGQAGDPLVGMDWIYDHTKGKTKDGKDTDFVWETGIKHDASNSRPEYSKMLRDVNARVRSDMAASS